ncbi:MAG: GAF domain-containing sensor histidine kinase [Kofleriaceae bacterium]
MKTVPLFDEAARIKALYSCDILDSEPDPELDALVAHAARLVDTPMALISLVAETRQWFAARIGIAGSETPRSVSFCTHTVAQRTPLIIRDARNDVRFADNPYVTGEPNVVFYGGWPLITSDGHALGSLCVIDTQPRDLTDSQKRSMALLARQVVVSLELRRANAASPLNDLLGKQAKLESQIVGRDRMARLVVHDLKNPLMTIGGNASYVMESPNLDDNEKQALEDIVLAAARMQTMLLDIIDVSRATDHDGGVAARRSRFSCKELVTSIVGSGQSRAFDSTVRVEIADSVEANADRNLLERVISNLVDNAQRFAPPGTEVVVTWRCTGFGTELCVADHGIGIDDDDKARVFEPFVQLDSHRTGRGLGLVFCSLAAKAHGGKIWIEDNTPRGTRFCMTIPDDV